MVKIGAVCCWLNIREQCLQKALPMGDGY